ncbi:hypothetical protein MYX64_04720 [Nitrospinae bacterium AH_259_B05_G02_I21]|nr:hypothetical protein [Nitrospinae bacterium AH_259_B05_G02_I21]MDA2932523.1 hypothetical protein [Nitrospinae bacterium AH-259-F20]
MKRRFSGRQCLLKVDRVTRDDFARVAAAHLLSPERLRLAVIGPFEDSVHFATLLAG